MVLPGLRVEVVEAVLVGEVEVEPRAEKDRVGVPETVLVEDGQEVVVIEDENTAVTLRVPLLDTVTLPMNERVWVLHSVEEPEDVGHPEGEPVVKGVELVEGVWVGLTLNVPRKVRVARMPMDPVVLAVVQSDGVVVEERVTPPGDKEGEAEAEGLRDPEGLALEDPVGFPTDLEGVPLVEGERVGVVNAELVPPFTTLPVMLGVRDREVHMVVERDPLPLPLTVYVNDPQEDPLTVGQLEEVEVAVREGEPLGVDAPVPLPVPDPVPQGVEVGVEEVDRDALAVPEILGV